jgi:hypothetical protein
MPSTSRPCRQPTAHNTLLNASKPLPILDDDSIQIHATSKEGTRTHSPEGDWVAILPIFGKLFLETVKAICDNFGITQKRFGLYNEFNVGRGKRVDGTFQNGIFQNRLFGQTGIFQNGTFQKESFRKYFQQNRNLSEWNQSERIFQKIFLAQPESFRMESFKRNLSENVFLAKPESFRMESFRRNLSENIFSKTGIFQNGIFQNGIFQNGIFQNGIFQNGIFQNGIFQKESFRNDFMIQWLAQKVVSERFLLNDSILKDSGLAKKSILKDSF